MNEPLLTITQLFQKWDKIRTETGHAPVPVSRETLYRLVKLGKVRFDILSYYPLIDSNFCEVEALGDVKDHPEDTKKATTKIKIGVNLGLPGFIKASVDFLMAWTKEKPKKVKKDKVQSDKGKDKAQLAASGDSSQLELNGPHSVGMAAGIGCTIKGRIGCWITLAEWNWDGQKYIPLCVKSAKIDGKILKEDTFYKLEKGKFSEVKL